MRVTPTHAGYQLLHEGTLALSQVESNGLRIDVGYLKQTRQDLRVKCTDMERQLRESKVWKRWQRRFGHQASLGSGKQLGTVLVKDFECELPKTASGQFSTDENDLKETRHPFVEKYLRWKKYNNANDTFLQGIEREVCDGFLHPNYNLNTAITYRSSSDNPNFQNYPIRDPEIGKFIRRCFIPRTGNVLVENDFKGVEVVVSGCYNKDPKLISYIKDTSLDMHRDMAMEIYLLPLEFLLNGTKNAKNIRYSAKNGFVFPEFYGDWYKSTAISLWKNIDTLKLEGPDGKSLYSHLAKHGITSLGECDYDSDPVKGTFEYHLKQVEKRFWKDRFKVYDKWKQEQYQKYLRKGYFDSYTGFRYEGVFNRKQTSNYPIQGSAFHCLLWTLIQNQKDINAKRALRMIVGQIHDSMISDIPTRELDDHIGTVNDIVGRRILEHWPWIIVPLTIETELVAPGKTWYDKAALEVEGWGSDDRVFIFNKERYSTRKALFNAMKG